MAKIPLRLYTREIENLINQGQTEEAIAHCRHILQTYPKYIEAYRLMGNAFLESQQYGEAHDLFQRVLSVFPDDFIAHAGISIIREDEGNLEAATWHMERAFEAQPSNTAVQSELKRLYGRRDGIAPPKVRLTRGALVRMYAKGELYHQAIAEIKAALKEDDNRPDLLTILARMYYLAGQKVDAAEICSNLLKKYPNCFEANKTLAEILPQTSRADDAEVYKERVIAIDPYYAQLTPTVLLVEEVPDNAVVIERYIYASETAIREDQPRWASALGISIDETQQPPAQSLPDWLAGTATNSPDEEAEQARDLTSTVSVPESPFAIPGKVILNTEQTPSEQTLSSSDQDNIIPDFLKDAGWTPGTGNADEETNAFLTQDEEQELAPGDIPDWLQSISPEGLHQVDKTQDEQGIANLSEMLDHATKETSTHNGQVEIHPKTTPLDDNLDWLASLNEPTSSKDEGITWSDELGSEDFIETSVTSPSLEKGEEILTSPPSSQSPSSEQSADDMPGIIEFQHSGEKEELPSWLDNLKDTSDIEKISIDKEDVLPDWIAALDVGTNSEPNGHDEEVVPDWLKEISPTVTDQPSSPVTEHPEDMGEIPHARSSEIDNEEMEHATTTFEQPVAGVTIPQETSAIGISQLTDTEPTDKPTDELASSTSEEIPDWIKDIQQQKLKEEQALPSSINPNNSDWLSDLSKPTFTEDTQSDETAQPAEEIPDWIKNLQPSNQQSGDMGYDHLEMPATEADTQGEIPDWLEDLPQTSESPVAESSSKEPISIPFDTQGAISPDWIEEQNNQSGSESQILSEQLEKPENIAEKTTGDEEAALAWLEGLAAKHGADEETLYIPQDQRPDAPPDWVASISDENQIPAMKETEVASIAEQDQPSSIENATPSMDKSEEQDVAELPDWLTSLQNETQEINEKIETENQEGLNVTEISIASETTAEEIDQAASENSPDWLKKLQAEDDFEVGEQVSPPQDTTENLPEWLTPIEDATTSRAEELVSTQSEDLQPDAPPEIFSGEEAALAWLENLAAKHGADEDTLYIPPEQRSETPPDWIVESMHDDSPGSDDTSLHPSAAAEYSSLPETDASVNQITQNGEEAQPEPSSRTEEPVYLAPSEPTELLGSAKEDTTQEETLEIELAVSDIQENLLEDTQPVKANSAPTQEPMDEELPSIPLTVPLLEQFQSEPLTPIEEVDIHEEASSVLIEAVQPAEMESSVLGPKQLLNQGKISEALEIYSLMIKRGENLEIIVKDLNDSLYYYPVDIAIWQSLGDAYLRANQIQDALNAYTKAEELLR